MESWTQVHPDWEYKFWNESNIPHLHRQDAFDRSIPWTQKSDILRLELLYRFGGIYVDSDEVCLRRIDPLIEDVETSGKSVMIALEGNKDQPDRLANGIMASTRGNELLWDMINEIDIDHPGKSIFELTGPDFVSAMAAKYPSDIYKVPSKVFFPGHWTDRLSLEEQLKQFSKDPEVLGIQLWGTAFDRYLPKWYRSPIDFLRYVKRNFKTLPIEFYTFRKSKLSE